MNFGLGEIKKKKVPSAALKNRGLWSQQLRSFLSLSFLALLSLGRSSLQGKLPEALHPPPQISGLPHDRSTAQSRAITLASAERSGGVSTLKSVKHFKTSSLRVTDPPLPQRVCELKPVRTNAQCSEVLQDTALLLQPALTHICPAGCHLYRWTRPHPSGLRPWTQASVQTAGRDSRESKGGGKWHLLLTWPEGIVHLLSPEFFPDEEKRALSF